MFFVAELSLQFDCLPNGEPIPNFPGSETEYYPDEHRSPEMHLPSVEPDLRARSRSPSARLHSIARPSTPAKPKLPARSRSTSSAHHRCSSLLGYKLHELKYIRLVPNTNPLQRFEVRTYTFPQGFPGEMKLPNNKRGPVPKEQQYVLETPNGEIVAILDGNNVLRGMYLTRDFFEYRVKMNINSGKLEDMTEEECKETPLGSRYRMSRHFQILDLNINPPH